MRQAQAILFGVATLVAVAFAAPTSAEFAATPIKVPVITKYITTEVQTVDQDETIVLIGQLCEQSKGMKVNMTVLLNNNPKWEPAFGVLRYYVVDSLNKNITSALCTNVVKGVAGPYCGVMAWPSTSDIYIKGTAGQSAAISFTLDAEIRPAASDAATFIQSHDNIPNKLDQKLFYTTKVSGPVYLTEIITMSATQQLAYHNSALLTFTFCPTPKTGTRYEVRSTTVGTDGQSAYAQYICDKLPCAVDGSNVIAHNGRQLPSNTVTTSSGQWKTLYALVVCWGGVYDQAKDEYIGHFLFNAEQIQS